MTVFHTPEIMFFFQPYLDQQSAATHCRYNLMELNLWHVLVYMLTYYGQRITEFGTYNSHTTGD